MRETIKLLKDESTVFFHDTVSSLALSLSLAGDHSEAMSLAEQHVERCKRIKGVNDLLTGKAWQTLATVQGEAKHFQARVASLETAVRIFDDKLGRLHRDSLVARSQLATAYGRVSQPLKQKQMLETTLQDMYGALPPGDSETLRCEGNLANALGQLGLHDEQLSLLQKVIASKERQLKDPFHPELARTVHNLGVAYGNAGNHVMKLETLARALDIKRRHFSATSPDIIATLKSIAQAHADLVLAGDVSHCDQEIETLKEIISLLKQQPQWETNFSGDVERYTETLANAQARKAGPTTAASVATDPAAVQTQQAIPGVASAQESGQQAASKEVLGVGGVAAESMTIPHRIHPREPKDWSSTMLCDPRLTEAETLLELFAAAPSSVATDRPSVVGGSRGGGPGGGGSGGGVVGADAKYNLIEQVFLQGRATRWFRSFKDEVAFYHATLPALPDDDEPRDAAKRKRMSEALSRGQSLCKVASDRWDQMRREGVRERQGAEMTIAVGIDDVAVDLAVLTRNVAMAGMALWETQRQAWCEAQKMQTGRRPMEQPPPRRQKAESVVRLPGYTGRVPANPIDDRLFTTTARARAEWSALRASPMGVELQKLLVKVDEDCLAGPPGANATLHEGYETIHELAQRSRDARLATWARTQLERLHS